MVLKNITADFVVRRFILSIKVKIKVLVKLFQKLAVSKGRALVAVRRRRNPFTSGAFQGVNFKTVRWTVLKEGMLCK